MGYFTENEPVQELLSINLNSLQNAQGYITHDAVKEIYDKISQFSRHYETIVVLASPARSEGDIIISGDIDVSPFKYFLVVQRATK